MDKTSPKKGDLNRSDVEALLEYFSTAELNALLERANSKPHERDTFHLDPSGVYIPDGTPKTLETPGGPAGHIFTALPSQFDTWAENDFYVPDRLDPTSLTPTATIGPIVLMPFQKVLFRYIFDPNRPYDDFYQDIIISCLKKTGKSAITSALGRWIAETWGNYSEVVTLGADREHAEDKLFAPIAKSIELSPGYESRLQTSFAMMVHPEDPDPSHPTTFVPDYQRPLWRLRSDGAQYIPNHGSIKTAPMDPKGAAGGNQTAALFTEMWVFDCFDSSTELLTKDGWKNHLTILPSDEMATINAEGFMEWEEPTEIIRQDYSGKMVHFKHKRSDQLVTPNHWIYGKFRSGTQHTYGVKYDDLSWDLQPAGELASYGYEGLMRSDAAWGEPDVDVFTLPAYKSPCVPGAIGRPWPDRPEKRISMDIWMEFLGWWMAEGSVETYKVAVAQSREANMAKCCRIVSIIEAMGYTPTMADHQYVINDVQLASYLMTLRDGCERTIPTALKNVSRHQLTLFLSAYLDGDGSTPHPRRPRKLYQASTVSKQLADDLLEIGMKCGYVPRLTQILPAGRWTATPKDRIGGTCNTQTLYRLSFSTAPIAWDRYHNHWSEEEYEGTIWCVTVPNHTVYARRNGFCFWSGNSKKARQVHAEFTPPPTRPRSVRIMEGYAGYEGQSGLWEELWELAMNPKLGARMVTREELIPYGGWPYPPAPHAFKDNPYVEHRESLDPIPLYVNDNYRLIAYLDQGEVARRMPWQTPAYYKGQVGDESFDRHHRNIPSAHTEEFISKHMWDACSVRNHPGYTARRDPRTNKPLPPVPERLRTIPPLEEDETIVLSFDGSVDDDTTSLMALSYATWWEYADPIPAGYTGDGSNLKRKRKVDDSQIMVRAYHVWEPSKARPMNFTTMVKPVLLSYYGFSIDPAWLATHDLENAGDLDPYSIDLDRDYDADDDYNQGDLDTDNTEGIPYVEGLTPAYNVLEVVYDYYQANDFFLNLRNDFGIWVKAFSQSTGRDKADRDLYVALRDKKIWHDGSPKLDEHRAGAAKRVPKNKDSSTANRIHIVKKSQRSKIDLMITMSQGSFELTRLSN